MVRVTELEYKLLTSLTEFKELYMRSIDAIIIGMEIIENSLELEESEKEEAAKFKKTMLELQTIMNSLDISVCRAGLKAGEKGRVLIRWYTNAENISEMQNYDFKANVIKPNIDVLKKLKADIESRIEGLGENGEDIFFDTMKQNLQNIIESYQNTK